MRTRSASNTQSATQFMNSALRCPSRLSRGSVDWAGNRGLFPIASIALSRRRRLLFRHAPLSAHPISAPASEEIAPSAIVRAISMPAPIRKRGPMFAPEDARKEGAVDTRSASTMLGYLVLSKVSGRRYGRYWAPTTFRASAVSLPESRRRCIRSRTSAGQGTRRRSGHGESGTVSHRGMLRNDRQWL